MRIQALYYKYVNYRNKKIRTKVSRRLAEIEADLPKQKEAIKELRISRDALKCAISTLEHDEFMKSAVDQLNEEIRHRQHLVTTLEHEQASLNVRMEKFPDVLEVSSGPALAYS